MSTTAAEVGKSEKKREKEKEDQRRESQTREDPGARKGRKVANHYGFPMICGSRQSTSRLAKAAGAKPSGQMRDEKLHPLWREAHFEVKKRRTPGSELELGKLFAKAVRAE